MEGRGVAERAGGNVFFISLKSNELPFASDTRALWKLTETNDILQNFVRQLEKKFDTIWYIGADFIGDELFERFMFHHGGFMEISLKGEIRAYFSSDKIKRFRRALEIAIERFSGKGRYDRLLREIKSGQIAIKRRVD